MENNNNVQNNAAEEEFVVVQDYETEPDYGEAALAAAAAQAAAPAASAAPASTGKKKKKKKKKAAADVAFYIFNFIFLTLFVVVTLYPILNTLAMSFNEGLDALRGGIYLWPRKFTLKNYDTVFNIQNIWTGAKISLYRTVLGTVTQLMTTALLAYVLSIKNFVFRKGVSFFYVLTMYVNAGLIPTFLWFRDLGLTNSFWVYVIPGMVSGFNLMVLRTFMQDIPESLRESAQLDGAGHLTIFFKVYCPLCKPVFATVALFVAVYHWCSWFDTMLYNRTQTEFTTLQYELMKLLTSVSSQSGSSGSAYSNNTQQAAQVTPTSVRAAATMVTSFPIVVLYPFLQRYFVTGLTIGGVKE